MKEFFKVLSFVLTFFLITQTSYAQIEDQTEHSRKMAEMEREAIVTQSMKLTEGESGKFWSLYKQYRAEVRKLDNRLVALVDEYANNYEFLSDLKAQELLNQALLLEEDRFNLRKDLPNRFRKALPTMKLIRYYQIENKLDAIQRANVVMQIPLVMDPEQRQRGMYDSYRIRR